MGRMINPASINLEQFLIDWHGAPNTRPPSLSDEFNWLPAPLRDWYEISGKWSSPLISLKQMKTPPQIIISGRKAVFMEDPTGDWLWAFDTEDLYTVYDTELHGTWQEIPEDIEEFLLHNAINEAIYSTDQWRECTHVDNSIVPEILTSLDEVSFKGWRWPSAGGRIFLSEMMAAEVSPAMDPRIPKAERSHYSEIRIAARTPQNLAYLDEIPSVAWTGPK